MAEFSNRNLENLPGTFYVDDQCLDCDLCREVAPSIFQRNDSGGYAFVARQPESDEERELCREAVEGCPCEAIGDDGDSQDWSVPSHAGHLSDPNLRRACKHCSRPKTILGRIIAFLGGAFRNHT